MLLTTVPLDGLFTNGSLITLTGVGCADKASILFQLVNECGLEIRRVCDSVSDLLLSNPALNVFGALPFDSMPVAVMSV